MLNESSSSYDLIPLSPEVAHVMPVNARCPILLGVIDE